jgi:hypothetical protein
MIRKKSLLFLLKHVAAIAIATGVWIVLMVYAIPHLPLANKKTFAALLHAQIALDHEHEARASKPPKRHLLLLGSSVVERGVDDIYLDTLFSQEKLPYYSTNSGSGGSFANANLVMFRAMLDQGLRPDRVIYGTILQEFNEKFLLHMELNNKDTSLVKLKEKSLWNVLYYGAPALSPILDGPNFHIYIFALNNAFRRVQYPTVLQRLSFGENMFVRDSSYQYNAVYFDNLKAIYAICKERHIPFALFNTPVRPKVESLRDLPYLHKSEAYSHLEEFATQEKFPIWNFDMPGSFDDNDFLDTYHLNARGAAKMTKQLAERIAVWQKGIIEQDVTASSADSIRNEIKDSLVRSVFHF